MVMVPPARAGRSHLFETKAAADTNFPIFRELFNIPPTRQNAPPETASVDKKSPLRALRGHLPMKQCRLDRIGIEQLTHFTLHPWARQESAFVRREKERHEAA